ncbi:DUF6461 domain-containing protein [Streptosporangium sp. NPDC001682]
MRRAHCVGGCCEHAEMIATPDDYSWFSRERFPELADAYCFTYVRGLTPEELVTRLGGSPRRPGHRSPRTAGARGPTSPPSRA